MKEKSIKDIKKVLMSGKGYIRIGSHTKKRMVERGYTKGDIVSSVMTGTLKEIQYGFNHDLGRSTFKYVIEGKDLSNNPIVSVLAEEGKTAYLVVTVMPPTDHHRFTDCI
ncbi:DUF4258 domain-containing protein [Ferdinandcohnia sp. SAFN-114]|uniref:DUF4258 domain-containing protein n=1 Tax=Ferdinandcohnia sp. SAFN-114 TaxID=3387275 RepID=UPI003F81FE7B